MAYRRCSECGKDLAGKPSQAKTCSTKCRSARSRRVKKQFKERGEESAATPEQREIAERVRGEAPDVAHKVIEEELRPVVRESITADTLQAIAQMVALTPTAVAALQEDLGSEDSTIRQRAYTLLMKYTVGHQAIVTPVEDDGSKEINVNFNLPRPSQEALPSQEREEPVIDAEVVRECDRCNTEKPEAEFIGSSTLCTVCYEKQQARATELLA